MGIGRDDLLVVIRPPASEALYHRFENELFDELIAMFCKRSDSKLVLLPRSMSQRDAFGSLGCANMIMPRVALDGPNLIAHADLIISAGGTMNREAAALGVPAASIYAGKWAAIDEELVREGRLLRIRTREDLDSLSLRKKSEENPRRAVHVRDEVVELILKN